MTNCDDFSDPQKIGQNESLRGKKYGKITCTLWNLKLVFTPQYGGQAVQFTGCYGRLNT